MVNSADCVRAMIGPATNNAHVAASVTESTSAPCLPWRASRYARLIAPARPSSGPSVMSVNTIGNSWTANTIMEKLLTFPASKSDTTNAAASTADQLHNPTARRVMRTLPILARSVGLACSASPLCKNMAAVARIAAHTIHEGRSTCDGSDRPLPARASMVRSAGPDACASITTSGTTVTAITAFDAKRGNSGDAK